MYYILLDMYIGYTIRYVYIMYYLCLGLGLLGLRITIWALPLGFKVYTTRRMCTCKFNHIFDFKDTVHGPKFYLYQELFL
jgi:hypothetical protein